LKDKQNIIWIGTYFGGVNFFNPNMNFFSFHDLQQSFFRSKPFPIISNIVADKKGNLFLGTEGNGLIYYNPKQNSYQCFIKNDKTTNSLPSNSIKSEYLDSGQDELWIGTHSGGLCKLDLHDFRFTRYKNDISQQDGSNVVNAIVPYKDNMLVATFSGVFLFDRKTEKFAVFSEILTKKISYCTDMKMDKEGNLWIGGDLLVYYNPETGEIKDYSYDLNNKSGISSNEIRKIFIDSKERVWIGTNGGGVNLFDGKSAFIRYDSENIGLESNYVSNLMQSGFGYIVIATTKGFSMLDVENNKIYNYGNKNGFPLNSIFNGGMCLTGNGEIFIAGMNGMISFYEENIPVAPHTFNLYPVNLWVNNKLVYPGDNTGILKKSMPYTQKIKLNYKQQILSVEFASDNHIPFYQISYRYKLDGYSEAWTELPYGATKLNFMNINPGNYKLIIEGFSNNNNVVASTGLEITVYPPFYMTWYAYLFYALLTGFAIWRYVLFSRSKLLLKTSLSYEKKEKEHLEEVNQSKLNFFTNISHEFRTPLTLINGQVDILMKTTAIRPDVYKHILSIKSNTRNMQNLITELLEFRKIEQGHLKIKACKLNIVDFLNEIYFSFSEYAHNRQIQFLFECQAKNIELRFDPVQMQKVFYNLISNAFKYTPKEGTIRIVIDEYTEDVAVRIVDTGIGVSPIEKEKIFDCFYQAENGMEINNHVSGTGIGLALTKNILTAHCAQITVDSELQAGSTFTVTIRKGSAHFQAEQLVESVDIDRHCISQIESLDDGFMQEIILTQQLNNQEPQYTMLIVEDHEELCKMLKGIFEPLYKIYTASDGEEGLALTIEHQPDIVLSDLMMPKMSGTEMCSRIKDNFAVCHIPVVLLTAQTAIESNIEGLRLGADDYITKPFDIKTLIIRCNNLVNVRKMLQEKFTKQADTSLRLVATNQLDMEFLEKTREIIDNNILNPEFDVSFLSREMALGRTKLFSKIKGITGQTPNDFIVTVKLKKAATLLTNHPEYNIADVCYMAGFNTPKYFTKCFREQFGISPSAYRK
jgi:signal transduction histidine kinase/DNA-binding response OmpR family regulator